MRGPYNPPAYIYLVEVLRGQQQVHPVTTMSAKIHWSQIPNNTNPIWYKDPGLRWNVTHGLGLCLVIATNGFGASLLGGFQANPSWIKFFNAPKGTTLGLYAASYFLPSVFTAYLGDFISGRYGRRWAIFVGMFLMLAGGVINAFAVNVAMWIVGRVIIGAGVGVVKVGTSLLLLDPHTDAYRSVPPSSSKKSPILACDPSSVHATKLSHISVHWLPHGSAVS